MNKEAKKNKADAKVSKVMGEFKRGELKSGSKDGPKVTDRKQAIAIALSEADKTEKIAVPKGQYATLDFLRQLSAQVTGKETVDAPYTAMIPKEVRAECVNNGVLFKCGQLGVKPSQVNLDKEAQLNPAGLLSGVLDAGTKGIVVGSVVAGVPMGIMAHLVHKKVRQVREQEQEAQAKIDYYNQATNQLESGLRGAVI